jgi:hypothetical protein
MSDELAVHKARWADCRRARLVQTAEDFEISEPADFPEEGVALRRELQAVARRLADIAAQYGRALTA